MADDGRLAFDIVLLEDAFQAQAERVKEQFKSIGDAAVNEGKHIDQAFANLSKDFDVSTIEARMKALLSVISENENTIVSLNQKIVKLSEDANNALANEDYSAFRKNREEITKTQAELADVIAETQNYKHVLEEVEQAAGKVTANTPTQTARFFASEDDYNHVKELNAQLDELKIKLTEATDQKGINEINGQIIELQKELDAANKSASDAASALGDKLGSRAAMVSARFYELNAAVKEQEATLEILKKDLADTEDKLGKAVDANDVESVKELQLEYQHLSEQVRNADDALSNLRGQQEDANAEWESMQAGLRQLENSLGQMSGSICRMLGGMRGILGTLRTSKSMLSGVRGALTAFRGVVRMTTLSTNALGGALKALGKSFWPLLAITAVITVFNLVSKKIKEQKEAIEADRKAVEEFNKTVAETASKPVVAFKKLQTEWNSLGNDIKAQEKFVKDNQSAFNGLEIAINNVADAEKLFNEQADAFVEAQRKKAVATAYYAVAAKEAEKLIQLKQEREDILNRHTLDIDGVKHLVPTGASDNGELQFGPTIMDRQDANVKEEEIREQEKKVENLIKKGWDEEVGYLKELSEAGIKSITNNTVSEIDKQQKRLSEAYYNALAKYNNDREKANEQLQFDTEQVTIDGMADGQQKTLAQLDLNHRRELTKIYEQGQERIEAWRKIKEQEWAAQNPSADASNNPYSQKNFENYTLTDADKKELADDLAYINQLRENENNRFYQSQKNAEKDYLNNILTQYGTFEQRRLKIAETFAKERAKLYDENGNLRKGVTQGNIDELNKQEAAELAQLYSENNEGFAIWAKGLEEASIKTLRTILSATNAKLQELIQKRAALGTTEGEEYDKLTKQIAEVAAKVGAIGEIITQNPMTPSQKDLEHWEKMNETVQGVGSSVNELGNQIGGVMGEAVKTLGTTINTAGNLIVSIKKIAEISTKQIEATSEAAAEGIRAAETASVILAIASAVIQLKNAVESLTKSFQEWGESIDIEWIKEVAKWVGYLWKAMSLIPNLVKFAFKDLTNSTKSSLDVVKELDRAFEQLERSINKAFSGDKGAMMINQIGLLMAKLSKVTGEYEKLAKEREEAQNRNWWNRFWNGDWSEDNEADYQSALDEYQSIQNEIADLRQAAIDAIFGSDVQSAIEKFADAYTSAWEDGTDAAKAGRDLVKEMMKDVVSEALKAAIMATGKIDEIRKYIGMAIARMIGGEAGQDILKSLGLGATLQGLWGSTFNVGMNVNDLADPQEYINMANQLAGGLSELSGIYENISRSLGLLEGTAGDRSASAGGFAQASQESVDELNGRATAIQGHTFNISANSEITRETTQAIYGSVRQIEKYTEKLISIDNNINHIRNYGISLAR